MKVETIVAGAFEANCFIVTGGGRSALVIDPGSDPENILDALAADKLTVAAYLLTHAHFDHISALASLVDAQPAPVVIHGDDLKWAFGPMNQMPPFYGIPKKPRALKERAVRHLEECADAGLKYRVLHTPGHSPGSVCFHFPDHAAIFSGDTLFAGSIGRTDFAGGSFELISRSLAGLRGLPGDTVVYPGHGPSTTLAAELETNPFMRPLEGIS